MKPKTVLLLPQLWKSQVDLEAVELIQPGLSHTLSHMALPSELGTKGEVFLHTNAPAS